MKFASFDPNDQERKYPMKKDKEAQKNNTATDKNDGTGAGFRIMKIVIAVVLVAVLG